MTMDERRIQACLRACEGLTTEALEQGLVADVFDSHGTLLTALSVATEVAAQGRNPAHFIRFDRVVALTRELAERMEAAGAEALIRRVKGDVA